MYYRIFDCWRLTAAMLIMVYHFLYAAPGGEAGIAFLHRLLPLLDMFFMISGFFITGRYRHRIRSGADYAVFVRRRIARLYPLHLMTLAFFAAIAGAVALGIVQSGEPLRWNLAEVPLHLLAIHAWGTTDYLALNYASWSVSAEFFCYFLFPLIAMAAHAGGLKGLFALLAVWIAGLEIASAMGVFPDGHWMTADTLGAWRAFADFILGGIIAVLVERRFLDTRSHVPGIAFLGLAVAAMILEWNSYIALAGFAGAMLFTALAETARPDSTRFLNFILPVTRVSFGIYLWHPVMEMLFLSLVWRRLLAETGLVSFYVWWLVPMIATVIVAIVSDRFLEKRFGAFLADVGNGKESKQPAVA